MSAFEVYPTPRIARADSPVRVLFRGNSLGAVATGAGGAAVVCAMLPGLRPAALALGTAGLLMGISMLGHRRSSAGSRRGSAWVAIALAVTAAFAFLASPSAFGAPGSKGSTGAPAGPAGVAAPSVTESTQAVLRQAKVEIGKISTELDASGIRRSALAVTVTNLAAKARSYELEFEARTVAGNKRITTDSVLLPALAPGRSANVVVFGILSDTLAAQLKGAKFTVVRASAY
ncbi:MAG: hypothetical protein ACT4PP_02375 [Sporichthyaceae bacterium]